MSTAIDKLVNMLLLHGDDSAAQYVKEHADEIVQEVVYERRQEQLNLQKLKSAEESEE